MLSRVLTRFCGRAVAGIGTLAREAHRGRGGSGVGRAEQGQPALVGLHPGERRPPRRREKSAAPGFRRSPGGGTRELMWACLGVAAAAGAALQGAWSGYPHRGVRRVCKEVRLQSEAGPLNFCRSLGKSVFLPEKAPQWSLEKT